MQHELFLVTAPTIRILDPKIEFYGSEHLVTESNARDARKSAENSNDPQPSTSGVSASRICQCHKQKLIFLHGLDTYMRSNDSYADF